MSTIEVKTDAEADAEPDAEVKPTVVKGPRHISGHVVVSKEYRKYYNTQLANGSIMANSINGVTTNRSCMECFEVKDTVKYSTTRGRSICADCKAENDKFIELDDVKHGMYDLTEWVPIIRDSEHNLILQHKSTKMVGLSSTDRKGHVAYATTDVELNDVLNTIEKQSIEYSEKWTHSTFYDMPISTYILNLIFPNGI
jgi:hypothetical protein